MLVPADAIHSADVPSLRWSAHLSNDWDELFATIGHDGGVDDSEYREPSFWFENLIFNLPFAARWVTQKGSARADAPLPSVQSKLGHTKWFKPWLTKPWRYSYLLEFFIPKPGALLPRGSSESKAAANGNDEHFRPPGCGGSKACFELHAGFGLLLRT